ncbi:MAG: hypothetical protein K9L82_09320 [Chromatiaceae bacterium]|nr:hypothetical protein [Chromatiaceae bacterium]MCF7995628.1 hypothetical protein [Chromatiaceae bacterium]MCF8017079.1 hypothetical protein [Chromatiaceae bacterium]
MTETRYQLIFSGRLQAGVLPEQAQQAVKERFRLSSTQLDHLFSGQRITVKRGIDQANAERYQRAFAAAGALIDIEPAPAASRTTPERVPPPAQPGPPPAQPEPASMNTVADPRSSSADQDFRESAEGNAADLKKTANTATEVVDSTPMQVLPAGTPIDEQVLLPQPPPDTSHLRLAPSEATSLEDCAPPPPAPPKLDLSALELAPIDPPQRQE